jgi:hypothetical protein
MEAFSTEFVFATLSVDCRPFIMCALELEEPASDISLFLPPNMAATPPLEGESLFCFLFRRVSITAQMDAAAPNKMANTATQITAIAHPGKWVLLLLSLFVELDVVLLLLFPFCVEFEMVDPLASGAISKVVWSNI